MRITSMLLILTFAAGVAAAGELDNAVKAMSGNEAQFTQHFTPKGFEGSRSETSSTTASDPNRLVRPRNSTDANRVSPCPCRAQLRCAGSTDHADLDATKNPFHLYGIRAPERPLIYRQINISTNAGATKSLDRRLSGHSFAEPIDRRFDASAVRDPERMQGHFDDPKGAEDHRSVDMSHMGDPERLARELADSDTKHETAFFLAVSLQRDGIVTARHYDGRHRV